MSEYITEWYWDERRNAPNQAQREEIVRCEDCRWRWGTDNLCMLPDGNGDYLRIYVKPDGFCAWGERSDK